MTLKNLSCIVLFFLLAASTHSVEGQDRWRWHIDNGTIIDGTGQPAFKADILVLGDSIAFIGKADRDTIASKHYVDAGGKVISPGFIDSHAHGDPMDTPEFRNFLGMGVTTIVLGQDGSSPAVGSLDRWMTKVQEKGPAVNIAMLSGHGSIRRKVGIGRRAPQNRELERMEYLLESDLEDGAFGMSTGLEYVPGMYAGEEELKRMAKVVGKHDGLVMSHMRSEDNSQIKESIDELAVQGQYADVHISHLKVVYGKGVERAEEILDYIDGYRKKGIQITSDIYPYTASFTGIGIVFPDWAKTTGEWKNALDERPDVLRSYLSKKISQRNGPDAILFGSGQYAGLTLKEAAEREGSSAVDLILKMGPEAASAAHFVMDRELQDRLIGGKKVMISSDGSPTMYHPRGYGSFAKAIRYYVNEKKILGLEEAIYKMSGLPSKTLGLKSRGTLEEGTKADILIFNPAEIKDRATFSEPHKLAEGFEWIMVNGKLVREKGKFTKVRKGKVLRRNYPEAP